jgi:hypothetical protein
MEADDTSLRERLIGVKLRRDELARMPATGADLASGEPQVTPATGGVRSGQRNACCACGSLLSSSGAPRGFEPQARHLRNLCALPSFATSSPQG